MISKGSKLILAGAVASILAACGGGGGSSATTPPVVTPQSSPLAIVISDAWQNRGLGTQLLKLLLQVARNEKVKRLSGMIMAQNLEMLHVAEKMGFKLTRELQESTVLAEIDP